MPVCYTHHEQAAALAAVSNAKAYNSIGVCVVTTGPAASNALTGLLAAWQDSVPVIFISGQTRLEQTTYNLKVRQRGSQECNILDVVDPWVKGSYFVNQPNKIGNILDEAVRECTTNRKGPVWIDLPVNLQWQLIEYKKKSFTITNSSIDNEKNSLEFLKCLEEIKSAKKPLFILGRPVKSSKLLNPFLEKLTKKNIPVVHTWGSCNNYVEGLLNVGIIGMSGQLPANIALRASDKLIFLGSHFSITQSGNSYKAFSKSQSATFVNIDEEEVKNLVNKMKSRNIFNNVEYFMKRIIDDSFEDFDKTQLNSWNKFLNEISKLTSPEKACNSKSFKNFVSPHQFIIELYKNLNEEDCVVIDGGGTALYAGFQCMPRDSKFKVLCSTSISAMGTGLPELCGAAIGKKFKRNFCIIGDGSLMFNLQELQTLKTNCPNSIIIVINNQGYLAIRHTQKEFLEGRYYGTSNENKQLDIPEIKLIAETFEYEYQKINSSEDMNKVLKYILNENKKSMIIELLCPPDVENLYTPSFKKNEDGTFTPNDLSQMKPFEDFDYVNISKKYSLDLNL